MGSCPAQRAGDSKGASGGAGAQCGRCRHGGLRQRPCYPGRAPQQAPGSGHRPPLPHRRHPAHPHRDSVDRLVKQLSEAFGAEAAAPEPAPPAAAGPAEEPAQRSSPPAGQGAERPPSPSAARPARPAGHGLSSVSKPLRHKPSNKFMATSGGTGRSPLSILRDDNSPSAPAPRQGKRHVLGENLGEKKEVDLSRSLKSGSCGWSDLNKENQQCPFVEN
ncbi:cell division cycle-associated protein 3 isoform X2 [Zonotrichia albicollis]|uniref:cell division cycle-associated protein 3 isoform X2 n=1 Tax=Zonotrichia albicollis TaxID=44394 RepID=UPI003D810697